MDQIKIIIRDGIVNLTLKIGDSNPTLIEMPQSIAANIGAALIGVTEKNLMAHFSNTSK